MDYNSIAVNEVTRTGYGAKRDKDEDRIEITKQPDGRVTEKYLRGKKYVYPDAPKSGHFEDRLNASKYGAKYGSLGNGIPSKEMELRREYRDATKSGDANRAKRISNEIDKRDDAHKKAFKAVFDRTENDRRVEHERRDVNAGLNFISKDSRRNDNIPDSHYKLANHVSSTGNNLIDKGTKDASIRKLDHREEAAKNGGKIIGNKYQDTINNNFQARKQEVIASNKKRDKENAERRTERVSKQQEVKDAYDKAAKEHAYKDAESKMLSAANSSNSSIKDLPGAEPKREYDAAKVTADAKKKAEESMNDYTSKVRNVYEKAAKEHAYNDAESKMLSAANSSNSSMKDLPGAEPKREYDAAKVTADAKQKAEEAMEQFTKNGSGRKPKKGLSTGQKIGIGVGVAGASALGARTVYNHKKHGDALYDVHQAQKKLAERRALREGKIPANESVYDIAARSAQPE